MAKPTPNPAQTELIEASKAQKQAEIDRLAATVPLLDASIAEKTQIDNAFKDQFNWYSDDVIGQYDAELKALNGVFVTNPITNADVEDVVFDPTNARLFPDPGDVDVKRIPEFDGGNTSTDSSAELLSINRQANIEDQLVNGFGGTQPTGTLTTVTSTNAIGPGDSQVIMDDSATPTVTFSAGNIFILDDGSNIASIEVTAATEDPMTPGLWTLDFVFVFEGSVNSGANIDVDFDGFNNTERTNKSSSDYQAILDSLVDSLETEINNRITALDAQITAQNANEDPDGNFDQTDINTSKTFLQNYLLTTDISDTGLTSLSDERVIRTPQINTRVSEIQAAYTGQSEDYYESRYTRANDRAQIRRGTLTEINRLELAKSSNQQNQTDRSQAIDSFDSIL